MGEQGNGQNNAGSQPVVELLAIVDLHQRATAEPGTYAVRGQIAETTKKLTKAGKAYLDISMADGGGTLSLKAWSDSGAFAEAMSWLGTEGSVFVEVTGHWEVGSYGLESKDWVPRRLTGDESAEVLAGTGAQREAIDRDFAAIESFVAEVEDPRLQALCQRYLQRFGERFRRSAGARRYHHARRGGLVEHVAQMMRAAVALCGVYPDLNRDLLVSGVLFHDCGKLWENCYPPDGFAMPYSLHGELLGHIPIGVELANKLWNELLAEDAERAAAWQQQVPSPEAVRVHLLHLIAAHHGEHQFGSPVVPKTPEATALHYIDNLDAKLEMFAKGYSTAATIGPGIQERVFPLPGPLVNPLPHFEKVQG
ncbi:HD domain-containing protein [soil metagenome]